MNYQEFLEKQRKFEKERYLLEFEEYPQGEALRRVKKQMKHDYEFINEIHIPVAKNVNYNPVTYFINTSSFYFEKEDNNTCVELITGKRFIRVTDTEGNVRFYNEDTGLFFGFDDYFEKAVSMRLDDVYTNSVLNYINYFESLKEEDDRLRNNALTLMLKKGIRYTK